MAEIAARVEIPNRALFKPAEVCDLVKVQPYVLRTWEAEFPELGVTKTAGGARGFPRGGGGEGGGVQKPLVGGGHEPRGGGRGVGGEKVDRGGGATPRPP